VAFRRNKPREIPQRVHFIGIGGAGMSGLAQCIVSMGREVSGSDLQRSAVTDNLSSLEVNVIYEHCADNAARAQLVVVSDAIAQDNVELEEARRREVPILRRAECLDLLCASKNSIFVAGSHGKSTTAAMIAKVLDAVALAPSFVIGAAVPSLDNQRARIDAGNHFVAEACEAFQNLALYHPDVAVITNIDDEHIEHYGKQAKLDEAFRGFAKRTGPDGAVVANGDDEGVRRILAGLGIPVTTFGFGPTNDISVASFEFDRTHSRFEVLVEGQVAGSINVPIPGKHAIVNALACVAACRSLGIDFVEIARALAAFAGMPHRWEDYGVINGVQVIDDYAHHPTELNASIETAQSIIGGNQRLLVAFQPQLFSRTRRLYREFAKVLSKCDHVFLLEIDPGGERRENAVQSTLILDEIGKLGGSTKAFVDVDDLVEGALQFITAGDFLLIAGAGSIRSAAPRICQRLASGIFAPSSSTFSLEHRRPVSQRFITAIGATFRSVFSQPTSVVSLFQSHVHRYPYRCAIQHCARKMSYGELDETTDALAEILKARGIVRGTVVAVGLPPSIGLVLIALALAKIRAIYFPVDDNLPSERVRFMLSKASARFLVTSTESKLAVISNVEKIDLEDLQSDVGDLKHRDTTAAVGKFIEVKAPDPNDAAYICFTSGSTGYPKGVAISCGSLLSLISNVANRFRISPNTRMALNTSISFDVSLAEIWMPLCGGGQIIISSSSKPLIGDRLADFIEENAISHVAITPSVLASVRSRALPSLKCIICAGEACAQQLVDTWSVGRFFFNAYGPTEATIYSTVAECRAGESVTIGKALKHINTYVIDQDLNQVRVGEAGELCLGGIGVAKGYVGLEEESKEKFVALCRGGAQIDWIYKTGDLVKLGSDGNLSFLGRLDNQIKIRGNRIELEEVEHSIKRIPGVMDAAVCVEDGIGSKELVCFIVVESNEAFDEIMIRDRLSTWLPSYMIPSHFVRIGTIPMTPSGKMDRLLLSKYRRKIVQHAEYESPRTEVECKLAQIWKDVLEADTEIGVYDHFTSRGGDSLMSLLLIDEVERQFGVGIPPGYFGSISTITRMAVQIADLLWNHNRQNTVVASGFLGSRVYKQLRDLTVGWTGTRMSESGLIVSLGNENPTYELFLCAQYEAEFSSLSKNLGDDFRVHSMRSGHLVMDYTHENIRKLSSHYVEEIKKIKPTGKLLVGGVCQGGAIAHAVASMLRDDGLEISLLIFIEQASLPSFEGRVAFIYAEDSFIKPIEGYEVGVPRYDKVYGDRYTIDIVPGSHGELFVEPNVHSLVTHLRRRIEYSSVARC
jgi:UDP-N-acetylmuramate--L-alanine ligase